MKRMHLYLFTLLLTLLAGCASQPPSPEVDRAQGDWEHQLSRIEALDRWTLTGKIGLRSPQQSRSANLDWVQQDTGYRMLISGPFGVGRNVLTGEQGGITLENGDGRFSAATPEDLMEQRMGWSLPISSLDHWVRGLPDPRSPSQVEVDAQGFPQAITQDGWNIEYRQWSYAAGYWLPGRLRMSYGDLIATLVVTQWQPNQTGS
ncbi:lipoprotein insertase outer membrane protein LolB [Halotalea alkalilenta]|uniref:lipoprotein insertase outer membrane protein LolB n=1 Tax=Halotalea alkalilenta TaxID=376489 RepID=UPI0005B7FB55|nr:lipoprotein insertase outer membrane protein LolB [Halotalea alkalilenta]